MNAIDIHREGLHWAYEMLEMVMQGVTEEQAHSIPDGVANPISATYAHALSDLDVIPNTLLQGKAAMYETAWQGKTGISEPRWESEFEWARQVRVDLPTARDYGKAMHAQADAYIAGLTEADLARALDLTSHHLGVQTLSWCITALITSHLNNMVGEISALKGIQGLKGYPF